MTGKQRVISFFKHEELDELPSIRDLDLIDGSDLILERAQRGLDGKDWFGVKWIWEQDTFSHFPCANQEYILENIEDWRDVIKWPDLTKVEWDKVSQSESFLKLDRENKVSLMMLFNGPFERLHELMGFENALCSLITNPEECGEFFSEHTKWRLELLEYISKYYKPDILNYHDDWGTQNNMFFNPDIWRKLLKPNIKLLVDKCHELGMFFEMHSCGKIEAIVPEFVEIGIDAWNGQDINDTAGLKKITTNKMGYHMNTRHQEIEVDFFSGKLTEENLRERVKENILENARGYNYFPLPLPSKEWWFKIMTDEIDKISKVIYK